MYMGLIGAACLLTAALLAQEPRTWLTSDNSYHPDPQHVANRTHRTLFIPWSWKELVEGPRHREALAQLDSFLSAESPRRDLEPVRALMLQRDLWALHDLIATVKPLSDPAEAARAELRVRLARAVAALALTEEQIVRLPDNYALSVASKKYPARYKSSPAPFLPSDLFDKDSPWVRLNGDPPLASGHTLAVLGRSQFQVFLNIPGGREATLALVKDLNGNHRSFPVRAKLPEGTAVALARSVVAIDTAGKMRLSPIVEGLQIRVLGVTGPGQQDVNAFKLDRLALFEGRSGGLIALKTDEEETPLPGSGQPDPANLYGTENKGRGSALVNCLGCHHNAEPEHIKSFGRLASLNAGNEPLKLTTPDRGLEILSRWKQEHETWKLLEPYLKKK